MFIDNKYTTCYNRIISNGKKSRPELKTEKHHIIPECFFTNRVRKGPPGWLDGDPNDPNNITFLTCKEHFICHRLLIKMLSGIPKAKMVHALSMMLANNQNQERTYRVTSRIYETLKIQLSDIMKEKWTEELRNIRSAEMKGDLNHFYGKQHTEETKEKMRKRVVSEETKNLISLAQIERYKDCPGTFLGKTHSNETRKKISELASRPKSVAWKESASKNRKGRSAPNKGIPHSEETKKKISNAVTGEKNGFFGKHHSPEQREKKRQEKLASPKQKCYYCNKEVDLMNFRRWHGDNCKYKK